MNYRPSDDELDKFGKFAGGMTSRSQITAKELLEAGIVPTRSEASRLMRYLDDNGVLSSTSKSSGFRLENLKALYLVRKGIFLIYPDDPDEPVTIQKKFPSQEDLPPGFSLEVHRYRVGVSPSMAPKKTAGYERTVYATTEIIPGSEMDIDEVNRWILRRFLSKLAPSGIEFRVQASYIVAPKAHELSAAEIGLRAGTPIAIMEAVTGKLKDFRECADFIIEHERREEVKSGRSFRRTQYDRITTQAYPTVSHQFFWEDFREFVEPQVRKNSPEIRHDVERMVMDLWRPHIISEDSGQTPVQVLPIGTGQPKKRNGVWSFIFHRSSD